MVPQTLQICKDSGFGHLALEATQSGFDPFVFADGDLGHEVLLERCKLGNLASPPTASLVQSLGRGDGRGVAVAGADGRGIGAGPREPLRGFSAAAAGTTAGMAGAGVAVGVRAAGAPTAGAVPGVPAGAAAGLVAPGQASLNR